MAGLPSIAFAWRIDRTHCVGMPLESLTRPAESDCTVNVVKALRTDSADWDFLRGLGRFLDQEKETPAENAAADYIMNRYWNEPYFAGQLMNVLGSRFDLCAFTDNELIVAAAYTLYGPVWNGVLRGTGESTDAAHLPAIQSLMSKVLRKIPGPADGQYVFRGIKGPPALLDSLQEGQVVRLQGYTSATQDPRVMTGFGSVCMLIRTTTGKSFEVFSYLQGEREVLIDHDRQFRVTANGPFTADVFDRIKEKKCETYADPQLKDWNLARRCKDMTTYAPCDRFIELTELAP